MKLIEFDEQNVIIAKDQPEYLPLPAHIFNDNCGTVAFCWKLSLSERLKLLFSGALWHRVLTFNKPLQPVILGLDKPQMESDLGLNDANNI